MAFGKILRKKRESLGLTLDEVARRCCCSKPYLSTVENNKVKNPPSDELLVKLERVLEFEPGLLVQIAHLERLPVDVRQVFENNQAEVEYWRNLIRKLIESDDILARQIGQDKYVRKLRDSATNNTQPVTIAGKLIPVINRVSAGYPVDYSDLDYPVGAADDYIRCPDLHDPNTFAVRVVGDSMEPKYCQGDLVVFSPNTEVNNGDDCFVRMADPHETTFKRVYFEADGRIRLQPRNQKYSPMILPQDKVNGIWKAVMKLEQLP